MRLAPRPHSPEVAYFSTKKMKPPRVRYKGNLQVPLCRTLSLSFSINETLVKILFWFDVQSGAATCSKAFVNKYLRVPQAIGLYCNCTCKQGELSGNILQNLGNKLPLQTVQWTSKSTINSNPVTFQLTEI